MPGLFDDMSAALAEVGRIRRGQADPATYRVHVPEAVDVKAIRRGLGLTQGDFAAREPEAVQRALAQVEVR